MFLLPVHTMFPELNVSAVVLGFCMRIVMAANFGVEIAVDEFLRDVSEVEVGET